jgi:acetylornithine deacetylase/succinyl-diaminopimelate desuccinylase-like protein
MDASLFEWCRRLIALRSVTDEGTRAIAETCAAEMLAPAGISARIIPSAGEGDGQVNLLATVRGRDGSLAPLVLNTHLDTVPPGSSEQWTACAGDPFNACVEDGRIYGLGAADTKLDFAAKVSALSTCGVPRRDVFLVGSFGEEHGLVGAKEMVQGDLLPTGSLTFVGEPSRLYLITAHKGLMVFELILRFSPARADSLARAQRLTFLGKAAHSSTPALGINAIELALEAMVVRREMEVMAISGGTAVNVVPARCDVVVASEVGLDAPIGGAAQVSNVDSPPAEFVPPEVITTAHRLIGALKSFADDVGPDEPDYAPPTLTCNVGLIRSTAGLMTLEFEMRPPPSLSLDTVRNGLAKLVDVHARQAPGMTIELREKRANPGFRTAAGSETVELAMGALAKTGLPLQTGVKSGCTEAGVYAAAGLIPVVIGPGPSTGVIHAPNEYNFLSDVEAAVRFYRALLEI